MTVSQFAKLHHVNKRTLHYYDNIGLFSPCHKGENNYRYYDYLQSMEFEYIRMLKEQNMGIQEIKDFLNNPGEDKFMQIAESKVQEIDDKIEKLKTSREILTDKIDKLKRCQKIQDGEIRIVPCQEERYFTTPYDFKEEDLSTLASHIKNVWTPEQYRNGIGSYLSIEKIENNDWEHYDGLFILATDDSDGPNIIIRPKGTYLCGYHKGSWDKLPCLYQKMLRFANDRHLTLTGYAYETGLNDFAISNMEQYVTQILIRIQAPDE